MKHRLKHLFKQARFRLTLWNTLFLGLVVGVLLVYIYLFMRSHFYDETKRYVHHEVQELAMMLQESGLTDESLSAVRRELEINSEFDHAYIISDGAGNSLAERNMHLLNQWDRTSAMAYLDQYPEKTYFEDIHTYRHSDLSDHILAGGRITDPGGDKAHYLFLTTDISAVVGQMKRFRTGLILILPAILIFVVCSGWLLAGMVLKPIDQIGSVMEKIREGNLDQKIPLSDSGDEFDRLAKSFNQMVDRIRESYERIAQFTMNASHELNTPVAVMKSELDVILSKTRSNEEYHKALVSQQEETERLSRLIQCMLWLARTDSENMKESFARVNLDEVLNEVYELYEPVAESKQITLELRPAAGLEVTGDKSQLTQLLSNLVDNAVKYSHSQSHVLISSEFQNGGVVLSVADGGPGIPEEHRQKIFDRFYKIRSTSAGHGLGLSIVGTIARIHKARIDVEASGSGGTVFRVVFPAAE